MNEIEFRHSGWAPLRRRVGQALIRAMVPAARIARFQECGNWAHVFASDTDPPDYKVNSARCHDRWCLPCGQDRAWKLLSSLRAKTHGKRLRFITLTIRTEAEPLTDSLDKLLQSFTRLRGHNEWKKRVQGGMAFIEVTHNATSGRWHPHLHVIAEGEYFPHKLLKQAWIKASRGSFIVDIRYVRQTDDVTKYLCKYVTKPLDPSITHDPDLLVETMVAMKGRHLVLCFGSWRKGKLEAPKDDRNWTPFAPLSKVIAAADQGDRKAIGILDALRRRLPCTESQTSQRGPPWSCDPGDSGSDCPRRPDAPVAAATFARSNPSSTAVSPTAGRETAGVESPGGRKAYPRPSPADCTLAPPAPSSAKDSFSEFLTEPLTRPW